MPYNHDPDDETYDDTLDPEAPSAEDVARFDRDGAACPACGSEVYDDAGVCPICGEILIQDTSKPKPLVIAVVVVMLIVFALFYVL